MHFSGNEQSKSINIFFLKGKVKFLKCILFLKNDFYYFKYVFCGGGSRGMHTCAGAGVCRGQKALESHEVGVTGDYEPSDEELRFYLEE